MQTNSKMVVFLVFVLFFKGFERARKALVLFSTGRKIVSKSYLKYVWFCEIPFCRFLSASFLDILPKLFHPQKQAGPSIHPFRAYHMKLITRMCSN